MVRPTDGGAEKAPAYPDVKVSAIIEHWPGEPGRERVREVRVAVDAGAFVKVVESSKKNSVKDKDIAAHVREVVELALRRLTVIHDRARECMVENELLPRGAAEKGQLRYTRAELRDLARRLSDSLYDGTYAVRSVNAEAAAELLRAIADGRVVLE